MQGMFAHYQILIRITYRILQYDGAMIIMCYYIIGTAALRYHAPLS